MTVDTDSLRWVWRVIAQGASGGTAQVARSCSRGMSSAGPSEPIENSARDAHLQGGA
jgi:hypothetical protein